MRTHEYDPFTDLTHEQQLLQQVTLQHYAPVRQGPSEDGGGLGDGDDGHAVNAKHAAARVGTGAVHHGQGNCPLHEPQAVIEHLDAVVVLQG